jgi:DNA-binding GntR family transcriptional regulator
VTNALRTDIFEGRPRPGQRLRAIERTERYKVSATPLREALQRLAGQDLVEIDSRLGLAIAPVSRTHLRDTYWMREFLEAKSPRTIHRTGRHDLGRPRHQSFETSGPPVETSRVQASGCGAATWSSGAAA